MRLLPLSVLASVSLTLIACSSGTSGETSSSANSAIIGGAADTGDPAVVEFVMNVGDDEGGCTATFITTNVLLTAAHCVVDDNDHTKIPDGATFKYNSNPTEKAANWTTIQTSNVHFHPSYDGDAAHDVAVAVLDIPANVTPIPINRNALTQADVGKAIKIVGYGNNTTKAGFGTKRTANVTLRALAGDLVTIGNTGKQACEGDSGGPAFMTIDGVVTLVATDDIAATDADCKQGDNYQRTDLQLDFIDQYTGTTTTDTGDPTLDPNADPSQNTASTDPNSTFDPNQDPTQVAANDPTQTQQPTGDDDDDDDNGVDYCTQNPDDPSCTQNAHSRKRAH